MTTENTIAAYEQMVAALRKRMSELIDIVPMNVSADIDQIITMTQIAIQKGALPFAEPLAEPVATPDRTSVQLLARWLWNRGFGQGHLPFFDTAHRAKLMDASGAGNSAILWVSAAALIAKVEARLELEPGLPSGVQHNLNEHEQWLPVASEPTPEQPVEEEPAGPTADPFKNSPRAEANRRAKAKVLARWLWDRSIDGDMLRSFTPKYRRVIARAAGINPPSTMDTWDVALGMISKMEARALANPDDPATLRHFLTENEQWSIDPHATRAA